MATTPVSFEDLPERVRAAVEARTGPIIKVETVSAGFNSAVSARIHTASGSAFTKGLPSDHRWVWTQQREADVNPYVVPLAPRLLWHIETDGWNLLGFETIDGHHADYSPGSPDLPKVVQALGRLGDVSCPDIPLRLAEQRLSSYVDDPAVLEYFRGDSLLHTDLNNHNLLITGQPQAHLVDWGWATRGAAWLDAAYWVIWLIAAGGHTPDEAEAWARRIPAWRRAPGAGANAFAEANARIWGEIAGADPDPWSGRMAAAARTWRDFRREADRE
ncbi:aminoglycoside phosphotransferase [Streptomyces sp. NPDC059373]